MADSRQFDFLTRDFNGMLIDKSLHGRGLHRTYLIDLNAPKAASNDDENRYPAVVKCFGPRGGGVSVFLRSAVNFATGRSSVYTKKRYKMERRVIETWQKHGFETFSIVGDLPSAFKGKPWLVTKFAEGVTLDCFLADQSLGHAVKEETMTRFWQLAAKRHGLALEKGERLLLASNPSLKHFMLMPGGQMLGFDFEVAFVRFAPIPALIGRELAGYVRSMQRGLNTLQFNEALKVMVLNYSRPEYLEFARLVDKSRNPVIRFFQTQGKRLGKKDRSGKLNAANLLIQAKKEWL